MSVQGSALPGRETASVQENRFIGIFMRLIIPPGKAGKNYTARSNSSRLQTWSVIPASIAGVTRNVE